MLFCTTVSSLMKSWELVRRDAELVFVGKRRGDHAMPQDEISRLMIKLAKEGRRVFTVKKW